MLQKKAELLKKILGEDRLNQENDIAELLTKETVSKDINKMHSTSLSFGDRVADRFSNFAGSWKFIIGFVVIIAIWIIINNTFYKPFDSYPFILLNLVLSCVAALQAPIIMMSQNKQEEKDRMLTKNEYQINVKSELLIEELNNKINKLLKNQEMLKKVLDDIQNKVN